MSDSRANWNLPPPPGFQGLREDLPLEVYEQLLPHWRQDGATYFVTFRLHDSLPQAKLQELRAFKADWERRHPPPRQRQDLDALARETMQRVETWLDQGAGSCCLRSAAVSREVLEAMHRTDGERCELGCYVVMPNHVHAVARPLNPRTDPLEKILQSWKGGSAVRINEILRRSGTLWQRESFDRVIRDEEHLWRVIQYIGNNPARAGLSAADARLWIRPAWAALGWRFEGPNSGTG
jgi:putative transposase